MGSAMAPLCFCVSFGAGCCCSGSQRCYARQSQEGTLTSGLMKGDVPGSTLVQVPRYVCVCVCVFLVLCARARRRSGETQAAPSLPCPCPCPRPRPRPLVVGVRSRQSFPRAVFARPVVLLVVSAHSTVHVLAVSKRSRACMLSGQGKHSPVRSAHRQPIDDLNRRGLLGCTLHTAPGASSPAPPPPPSLSKSAQRVGLAAVSCAGGDCYVETRV